MNLAKIMYRQQLHGKFIVLEIRSISNLVLIKLAFRNVHALPTAPKPGLRRVS